MEPGEVEETLVNEIHLERVESRVFLLVTMEGKMTADTIASRLEIAPDIALDACMGLVRLGGFIEMSGEFEAMHPRFAAVNMYRRMCERENVKFGRNNMVDRVGRILEKHYDDARTK